MRFSVCRRLSTRAATRCRSSEPHCARRSVPSPPDMAVLDVAGFVADLKDHAVEHGFHVHDERHFVETYSMRQAWEVDLHPEDACGGPLDLHLAIEVEPRTLLAFEDEVLALPDEGEPSDALKIPLVFNWSMPPMVKG